MKFAVEGVPYQVHQDGCKVVFENKYTCFVHDLDQGGELSDARVINGSNANLLAAPQRNSIGLLEHNHYIVFSSLNSPAEDVEIFQDGELCGLTFTQRLHNAQGDELKNVLIRRRVTYHPWGYSVNDVTIECAVDIAPVGQVQIGSLGVVSRMDCMAVREASVMAGAPWGTNAVSDYKTLSGGWRKSDVPAYYSRHLPLSILLFKRGLEGIEYARCDNLQVWDDLIKSRQLYWQQGLISFDRQSSCYEVRMCPVDTPRENQFLPAGSTTLSYRMTLPYVKKHIVPLRPLASNLFKKDQFADRWPTAEEWKSLGESSCTLMRLHNDGDRFNNGIFWRDADYPPYPADEMAKMDQALAEAGKNNIAVTPYFSVKEFHPEAAGYAENAMAWRRTLCDSPDEPIIVNGTLHGVYGGQMCLKSNWYAKRRDTIDEVLNNHAFGGVYFDWCGGSECYNREHFDGRHWDNDAFQELMEWSRQRAGDGEVYLHMTNVPSLAAENLASMVLTEEVGAGRFSPEMFSPHVHFMNIAPRSICQMLSGDASRNDRRCQSMAALLNHATVSMWDQYECDFISSQSWLDSVTKYCRHTAPGEGLAETNSHDAGIAAYWNEEEILVCLANFSEKPQRITWQLSADIAGKIYSDEAALEAFEFKTFTIKR